MISTGNRVLPIKYNQVHLSLKLHTESETKKANSISVLTARIAALFKQYEDTMIRLKARSTKKKDWHIYLKHQEIIKTFTKDTKTEKSAYLKRAVIEIKSALEQLNRPLTLRIVHNSRYSKE